MTLDLKLNSYADRVDRLEEERKALGVDVREVFVEVKSAGYNPKALRKVLAERRKKTDEEFEAEVEAYRAALGIATYRAVADRLGVSKSKLQRLVPRKKNGTDAPPHTPDGVILPPPADGGVPDGTTTNAASQSDCPSSTTGIRSTTPQPLPDGEVGPAPAPDIDESSGSMDGRAVYGANDTGQKAHPPNPAAGVEPRPEDTEAEAVAILATGARFHNSVRRARGEVA